MTQADMAAEARQHGERVVRSPWFERLARVGFAGRALVYAVVGVLVIRLAGDDRGSGGGGADQDGALRAIADQPLGRELLVAVAVALGGYALWRFVRAAMGHGPEGHHDDRLDRLAALCSAVAYTVLCITAVQVLAGASTRSAGDPGKPAEGVLGWPGGPWLVGAAGVVLVGVGLYQGHKGVTRAFLEDSKTEEMSERVRSAFTAVGVIGHLARTVVFGLVGWFLIKAAMEFDAQEAVGLDGALGRVQDGSAGPLLLGVVAVGLLAFAVYSAADARYRRV